jgi:hypothetical protein
MILTPTKIIQLLVEVSAHLADEGLNPSQGEAGEDYDAKVGFLAAKWVISNKADQNDIYMLSNMLCTYCGYNALRRFCDDVEKTGFEVPYDFYNLGPEEFIVHGHPGLNITGVMDIYDTAARGRTLGWKRDWCPFRHNAEVLWYAGWDGADRQRPELVQATHLIAQVIVHLK